MVEALMDEICDQLWRNNFLDRCMIQENIDNRLQHAFGVNNLLHVQTRRTFGGGVID